MKESTDKTDDVVDLDFDDELTIEEATTFGILGDINERMQQFEQVSADNPVIDVSTISSLETAVHTAMNICNWHFVFFAWCEEYLFGNRQHAIADVHVIRNAMKYARWYWGPKYFRKKQPGAKEKYIAIKVAQATISAVQRPTSLIWLAKVAHYASVIEEGV